jgi:hypothetical protein
MSTPIQIFNDRFPNIKLSYDKINHKIVCGDLYMIIPFGTKVFIWFTYYNNNNVCFIIEKVRNTINVCTKIVSFNDDLCIGKYGTLLYGTIIKNNITPIQYFYAEDIFYYKGSEVKHNEKINKITYIDDLFNNINQNIYVNTQLGLCSPFVATSKESAIDKYLKSPFPVYCIISINLKYHNTKCCFANLKIISRMKVNSKVFLVKPDSTNDIYKLYTVDKNSTRNFDSYALITTYELSKTMNSIFRIIKENNNLDSLEESDDEDDFENVSEYKYIKNLTGDIFMQCDYSSQFNKWIPNKIVSGM